MIKRLLLAALLLACGDANAQLLSKFGPVAGILVGQSTTNPQTVAATSTNVIGLFSGTCNSGTYLSGSGACSTPAGVAPTGAANLVYATPNGSSGSASLRAIVGADVPPINLGSTANGGVSSSSILLGTNGGTSNGFFSVTGPTTSLKTFTFPNASATVLTTNAAVTVPQGGTGVGTLSGLVKGNGTSAFTAAASSDVIALFSGTCSSTTFLRGDGQCATAGGGGTPGGANTNIQFNNSGVFGGDSGLTYAGSGGTISQTGNTNAAVSIQQSNASAGTTATVQIQQTNNNSHSAYFGIAGSGNTGVQWTGGPTGEQAYIGNSGNIPLVIGNNNTVRVAFNGYSAPAGRQFDIVGNASGSTAVGYVGIIDQSGTRYGYFGKSSNASTSISYESDNAVALVANNGADSFTIDTLHAASITGATTFSAPQFALNGLGTTGTNGLFLASTNTPTIYAGGLAALSCSFPNLLCTFNSGLNVQVGAVTTSPPAGSTTSCANASFCNVGSFTSSGNKVGLVFCTLASSNDSANYDSIGIVGVNGTAATLSVIKTAALMTMQIGTGTNVQCKQSSGAANNITYKYIEFYQ